MPSLLIDDLDPALHARLLERAAAHRRAPEAEARLLLQAALNVQAPAGDLLALAQRLFGPEHGTALDLPARDPAENRPPPDFGAMTQ